MNESKTPRTDELLLEINEGRVYKTYGPVADLCRELELENAELKRQLEEQEQSTSTIIEAAKLNLRDCEKQLIETKAKLAEYDRLFREMALKPTEHKELYEKAPWWANTDLPKPVITCDTSSAGKPN